MHRRPAREQRRVASVVLLELSASNAPLDRRPAHNRIIQMNTAIESEKARPILHNVPIRDTHHSAHGRGRDEDCSSPPRRSRRALLTHRAPPSGSGVEAMTGQRVQPSDWRKEAIDEPDELLPAEACRLAAPLERREPEPLHLVE